MRNAFLSMFGLLCLLAFLLVQPAAGQEPTPSDDEVNAIAKQVYCPVCENVPLDVCPTLACEQWRGIIREKLTLGWSEEKIKQFFLDQYGDRALATPPARGFNWLVYLLPPMVFFLGVIVLLRAFRSWSQNGAASLLEKQEPQIDDDPYVAQLEEELRKRET